MVLVQGGGLAAEDYIHKVDVTIYNPAGNSFFHAACTENPDGGGTTGLCKRGVANTISSASNIAFNDGGSGPHNYHMNITINK
ncbi:hypothetical protein BH10PSE19_BH10PSE19_13810 [soil metagenome]